MDEAQATGVFRREDNTPYQYAIPDSTVIEAFPPVLVDRGEYAVYLRVRDRLRVAETTGRVLRIVD